MSDGFIPGSSARLLRGNYSDPSSDFIPIRKDDLRASLHLHSRILGKILLQSTNNAEGSQSQKTANALQLLLDHLEAKPEATLLSSFQTLSPQQQKTLHDKFGKSLEEIFFISRERDSRIFYENLLSLGRRSLDNNEELLAGTFFQFLAQGIPDLRVSAPDAVRGKAIREWDAMRGVGALGPRLEYLGRNFVEQVSDPGMIAGMGMAGIVASGFKLGALARFAAEPANFWTRGWVVGMRASAVAFPAEILAFWGTNRAFAMALNPENLKWDAESIFHEIGSFALGLALLKSGNAMTGKLFDQVHGFDPLTQDLARLPALARYSRPLAQQLGMFTGITTSHFMEGKLGWRPVVSGDSFWSDSLVTLLNFNLSGQLSSRVMGLKHAALMQEMALRTQGIEEGVSGSGRGSWLQSFNQAFTFQEAALTTHGIRIPVPGEKDTLGRVKELQILMNAGDPEGEGGNRGPKSEKSLSLPPSSTPGSTQDLHGPVAYLVRLMLTEEKIQQTDRNQVLSQLYDHMDTVKAVLKLVQEEEASISSPPKAPLGAVGAETFLRLIRIRHFESLSDRVLDWVGKFAYLMEVLRPRQHEGTLEERKVAEKIFESVEQKFLESGRYFHEKESYMGDEKGLSPKSFFNEKNYPPLLKKYKDHLDRFGNYIERHPDLLELLKGYRGRVVSRYVPEVEKDDVRFELSKLREYGLSPVLLVPMDEVLSHPDVQVPQEKLWAFSQLLKGMIEGQSTEEFIDHYKSIHDYLNALASVLSVLPIVEFNPIGLYPWALWDLKADKPEVLREELKGRLVNKLITYVAGNDPRFLDKNLEEVAETMVGEYFGALENFSDKLNLFQPVQRGTVTLGWDEVREQLTRKNFLKPATLEKILAWCGCKENSPNNPVLFSIRSDAVAGMLDFVFKKTHSEKVRSEIIQLIEEVVRRDDERMMEVIFIRFNNYRLGMMRDRLQIKAEPSGNPLTDETMVQAHDQFLEAIRQTSKYYLANPELTGPYLEIVEKLSRGKLDENARLAFPVWLKTQRLLEFGGEIQLSRRGMGSGILHVKDPSGKERIIAVTSILPQEKAPKENKETKTKSGPISRPGSKDRSKKEVEGPPSVRGKFHPAVSSARDLEYRLDIAEKSLLSDGGLGSSPDQKDHLSIYILIPSFRSGLSKRDLELWARDYLERHPLLDEIHLEIPKSTNEVEDPLNPDYYREIVVNRLSYTTEGLIGQLIENIPNDPDRPDLRLEIYRLRRRLEPEDNIGNENWDLIKETYRRFPAINAVREEFRKALEIKSKLLWRHQKNVLPDTEGLSLPYIEKAPDPAPSVPNLKDLADFINTVLGTSLPENRFRALIELSPSPFAVRHLEIDFRSRKIDFRGEIHPPPRVKEKIQKAAAGSQGLVETEGSFSFSFHQHPEHKFVQAEFENLVLPEELRGRGVGSLFFSEFVRLACDLEVPLIHTENGTGMHALWGWQFKDPHERTKMMIHFEDFLESYLEQHSELGEYDIRSLREIKNPQQVVKAYLDPMTGQLKIPNEAIRMDPGQLLAQLQPELMVGKQFFKAPTDYSYNLVFNPDPTSPSMIVLNNYLQQLLLRHFSQTHFTKH